jgi:hypothetical protein
VIAAVNSTVVVFVLTTAGLARSPDERSLKFRQ